MRADQARHISIPLFLERAGHTPAKTHKGGRELWYASPLRAVDRTPSFKVDTALNLWFDHGLDRGGNIIDLVVEMRRVTVKEALAILASGFSGSAPAVRALADSGTPAGEKEKDWSFEILGLTAPAHPALLTYLASRCIDIAVAKEALFEVRFRRSGALKTYFGLGFPSGAGFDVRNSLFKGFVGKGKDISKLRFDDHGTVAVFEGAFDYLTWLTMRGLTAPDYAVLILHSIAFKRRAFEAITAHGFGRVLLFLDHDSGGRETTAYFQRELGALNVVDRSADYAGFKDLNEWWVAQQALKSS